MISSFRFGVPFVSLFRVPLRFSSCGGVCNWDFVHDEVGGKEAGLPDLGILLSRFAWALFFISHTK